MRASPILASLLLLFTVAADRPPEDEALEVLLEGVSEIAGPGSPGGVCALGPDSFVVVAGRGGTPVVAATTAGDGRVMVLGHGGFLGTSAFEAADTGRFMRNSLRWLAGSKRKPLIGCPENPKLAAAIEGLGLRATAQLELEGVDCLVLGEGGRARKRIALLQEFVRDGGGLMVAATGWGWQQLNTGKQLARDLHSNRLLEPLGLAFTLEMAGETGGGGEGYVTDPRPLEPRNASEALVALLAGETDSQRSRAAQARLRGALPALSDHEPLVILPLRERLEGEPLPPPAIEALRPTFEKRTWRPLSPRWSEWQLVGPFAHKAGDRGITEVHPPERSLRRMALDGKGPDLTERLRGKAGRYRWYPLELPGDGRELDVGMVRLRDALASPTFKEGWERKSAAYLYRRVEATEDTELDLRLGSEDGCRLWCNGELLVDRPTSGGIELDQTDLVLPLKRGVNHLLVKVAHGMGPWGFRLGHGGGVDQMAIDEAIDRGVDFLLERQLIDGSWTQWPGYGTGYTALVVYTLLKSGLDVDHLAVRRGLAYVTSERATRTYSQSCKILALAAAGRDEDLAVLPELVEELVDWQEGPGLYAYPVYPDGQTLPPDLSNTLYAALALRAASGRGVEVPSRCWQGLIQGTLRCRERITGRTRRTGDTTPAGFSYRAGGEGPTGSMTTAALSVLVIARDALGDGIERKVGAEVDSAIAGGLAWLDREMTWNANPGKNRWHYFFLYGIERVGALLEARILGKVNWYPSGAEYLVKAQSEGGSWTGDDSDRNYYHDTVLALLFLSRATAPSTGGGKRRGREVLAAEDPEDDLHFRAIGSNPYDFWITGFSPRVVAELGYPASRTAPEVEKVWYTARPAGGVEEVLLAEVPSAPDGGAVQRFEARVRLEDSGVFELFAHALVRRAQAGEGAASLELTSGPLSVEVSGGADWDAPSGRRNLLRGSGVRVTASTTIADGQDGRRAVDGLFATRWRCAANDEAPWWKASLGRPTRAGVLLLSHQTTRPMDHGESQVASVEVIVNGGPPIPLELPPNPSRKAVLELPAGTEVSELEVRITGWRNRTGDRQGVGFSEIELLSGR